MSTVHRGRATTEQKRDSTEVQLHELMSLLILLIECTLKAAISLGSSPGDFKTATPLKACSSQLLSSYTDSGRDRASWRSCKGPVWYYEFSESSSTPYGGNVVRYHFKITAALLKGSNDHIQPRGKSYTVHLHSRVAEISRAQFVISLGEMLHCQSRGQDPCLFALASYLSKDAVFLQNHRSVLCLCMILTRAFEAAWPCPKA